MLNGGNETSQTILVLTDIHAESDLHVSRVADLIKNIHFDAVVLNGDNVNYGHWRHKHHKIMQHFGSAPVMVTWGNHDGNNAEGHGRDVLYDLYPERTALGLKNVLLVGMDSGGGRRVVDMRKSVWPWELWSQYRGVRRSSLRGPWRDCTLVFTHIIPREIDVLLRENKYAARGRWSRTIETDCGDENVLSHLGRRGVKHVFSGHNHCNMGRLVPKTSSLPTIHAISASGQNAAGMCGPESALLITVNTSTCAIRTEAVVAGHKETLDNSPAPIPEVTVVCRYLDWWIIVPIVVVLVLVCGLCVYFAVRFMSRRHRRKSSPQKQRADIVVLRNLVF